jgi:hypothetical protein
MAIVQMAAATVVCEPPYENHIESLGHNQPGRAMVQCRMKVVREGGLEPPRSFPHKVLSLARLPFRHSRNRGSKRFNRLRLVIQGGIAAADCQLERKGGFGTESFFSMRISLSLSCNARGGSNRR